jgi:uncharacterized protein (TIGR02265 family)
LRHEDDVTATDSQKGTTKGAYFNGFLSYLKKENGEAFVEQLCTEVGVRPEFSNMTDYPIEHFVALQELALERLHPGKPVGEGMFKLGELAHVTFLDSFFGKVMAPLIGSDLGRLAGRLPELYRVANKFGSIETVDVSPTSFRAVFRNYRHYPEYHHGLLSCGVRRMNVDCALVTHRFERRGRGVVFADFDCKLTRR